VIGFCVSDLEKYVAVRHSTQQFIYKRPASSVLGCGTCLPNSVKSLDMRDGTQYLNLLDR
jgi:hypothetical protein